jgi:hypothetical protein
MMKKLAAVLFGAKDIQFVTDLPLNLAIERLAAAVALSGIIKGSVALDNVMLFRSHPFVRNSFQFCLCAEFATQGRHTLLTGCFTLRNSVRLFLTFSYGFIACFMLLAVYACVQSIVTSQNSTVEALGASALMILGAGLFAVLQYAIVKFGQWLSRNDVQEIAHTVCTALQCRPPNTLPLIKDQR